MKRNLTFSLLSLFMVCASTVKAQDIITAKQYCFTDEYGYQWVIQHITNNHNGTYSGTGKVYNAFPSGSATFFIDFSNGHTNAPFQAHAINDNADGCQSGYTDSFTYYGNATCTGKSFTASGDWVSYCSGTIINSGTWDAAGPCSTAKVKKDNKSTSSPALSNQGDIITAKQYCFTDNYGEQWVIQHVTNNHNGTYSGTGVVYNAYPSTSATYFIDFRNGHTNAPFEAHAINDNPDGCNFYSDSFIFYGNATCTGKNFTASGDWASYCFGSVLFTGTWDAAGPCGTAKVQRDNKTITLPTKGNHAENFSISAVPNPVKNYTKLQYKVSSTSKVNITIYDNMHRPVKILVNGSKTMGNYSVDWNATNQNGTRVQSGLYRVVAIVNGKVYSRTIQVL